MLQKIGNFFPRFDIKEPNLYVSIGESNHCPVRVKGNAYNAFDSVFGACLKNGYLPEF